MSSDPSRRFTDREVSVILRRAVEIDESRGGAERAAAGLSLDDLRQIAREVGISTEAVDRAVAGLGRGPVLAPVLTGAPVVRRAVRGVPGELSRDRIARLVQAIDERADHTGAISEALGSVRWTASDRLRSSLVTITPTGGETRIQVVEKTLPRVRRLFHLLPAAWGVMATAPVLGMVGAASGAAAAGVAALGLVVGVAAGRAAWTLFSADSARRVERLADDLAREAGEGAPATAPLGAPGRAE